MLKTLIGKISSLTAQTKFSTKEDTHNSYIKVSHLIPLYQSARFFQIIIDNIFELADEETEFILADSNGDVVTCDRLREELVGIPNVQIICDSENLTWVENIFRLTTLANGKYFQILPHDDSTSKHAVKIMLSALEAAPDAVLAYGRVRAIDLDGEPIPDRDELNLSEDPHATDWTIGDVLPLFWVGRFCGAFKGLVRTEVANRPENYLRSTSTTVYSERVWLFSLALAGRFVFVAEDTLHKRYYSESTHRQWAHTPEAVQSASDLMILAIREKITNAELREYAIQDVISNSALCQHALRYADDFRFKYCQLPDGKAFRQTKMGLSRR